MHLTALAAVLWFVSAVTAQISDEEPSDYHQLVGISLAQRIKDYEERVQSAENSRIYRGSDVLEQQLVYYSFFAGLIIHLLTGLISYCGAALVSHNMLVTAAHCWKGCKRRATEFTVVLGSRYLYSGGTRIDTCNVITHPLYNCKTRENDIAVVRLPYNLEFSSTIFPISLPAVDVLNSTFASWYARTVGRGETVEDAAAAAGLGKEPEPIMRAVDLRVITDDECRATAGGFVPAGIICTSGERGKNPCKGDSGGPLFTYNTNRKYLIGIISRGYGCGFGRPAIYIRVSDYVHFIRSQGPLPNFSYHFEEQGSGVVSENITISYTKYVKLTKTIKKVSHFAIVPELPDMGMSQDILDKINHLLNTTVH